MNEIIIYNNKIKEKISDYYKLIIGIYIGKYTIIDNKYKDYISTIDTIIPLYDIYHNNIFLIKKDLTYDYVFNKHYRFPSINIIKKYKYFFDNYNINILRETFNNIFKEYAKNLTDCKRPSFISYLLTTNPYYTKSELINIALNHNLKSNDYEKYCDIIKKNDISADTLIKHQEYIKKFKYIIKNFSLLSSSKYNYYLRKEKIQDIILDNNIKKIGKLIDNAPKFDNDYYVYRFISTDDFLSNIKIGDIFIDTGFISSTRNQFYDPSENVFGEILLKIKLPKNVKGVGICIETYSVFPNEQEIILAHGSKLKLINKGDNFKYYHINEKYSNIIKKKYEFEWVGKQEIKMIKELSNKMIPTIEWKWNLTLEDELLSDRIKFFLNNYTYQNKFILIYNKKEYIVNCDRYNSLGVYKKFFFINSDNGLCLNIQNKDGLFDLFFEVNNEGSANFISRYIDNDNYQNDDILLELIGIFSIIFKIIKVFIHPYYKSLKKINNSQYISGDNIYICYDIYNYLTTSNKRFEKYINYGIENKFYYFQLDKLKKYSINDFISNSDENNLYSICKLNNFNNLLELYLYLIKNDYNSIKDMDKQLENKIFFENNPFDNNNKYYLYYPYEFLYNNKIIPQINKLKKEKYNIIYNYDDRYEIPLNKDIRNHN
jgi:hypothetical protein